MRKEILANHCFYHVYNRGVDKRDIFIDKRDYFRFIRGLFEFNNSQPVRIRLEIPELEERQPRELMVAILCFCLMPNHFHLILEQLKENGVANFMQKLGVGYTSYFNEKYERSGVLFQGAYKVVQVETEQQLLHLSRYVHINPAELIVPDWKLEGIENWGKVNKFLENYRWSSYQDYIGKKNCPSLTDRELISGYFAGPEDYKKFINEWVIKDWKRMEDIILE